MAVLAAPAAALETAPVATLGTLQADGAQVTALAVAVESGRVLAQLNANQRLVPASLSKLFTAALALRPWGSDKTRSEARRVGKEGGRTCRSRWAPNP